LQPFGSLGDENTSEAACAPEHARSELAIEWFAPQCARLALPASGSAQAVRDVRCLARLR
jgi:hypothetical protein